MTIKLMMNLLKVTGPVTIYNYRKCFEIRDMLIERKNDIKVLNIEWKNYKGNSNYYDKPEIFSNEERHKDNWITYDSCLQITFENLNSKIHITIKVYDGDMLEGYRKGIRWIAELIVPDNFVKKIKPEIQGAVDQLSDRAYDLHLESKRHQFKQNFVTELINLNK